MKIYSSLFWLTTLMAVLLSTIPTLMYGQNLSVSGIVTNESDGGALIGVTVMEKGGGSSTITDVGASATICIRGIGTLNDNDLLYIIDSVPTRSGNPELNVDDIAKSLGLSRVQPYRKLKSLTDYTLNELIRTIRLKYASRLLSSHNKSIAQAAYESGFSSPSYFTK